jgi:hypothetical protein
MRQVALAASIGAIAGCLVLIASGGRTPGRPTVDQRPEAVREIEIIEHVDGDIVMRRRTYQVVATQVAGEEIECQRSPTSRDTARITLRGQGAPVMLLVEPTENQRYPFSGGE